MPDPSTAALSLLVRRLSQLVPLSAHDSDAIHALPVTIKMLEPASYILREGDPPKNCAVLLSGFTFRQKLTSDGARQIVGLHIPGDSLDFQTLYVAVADHNVQTLTRVEIALIPREAIQRLFETHPAVAHAIMVASLVEASIAREWLLNIGRRNARTRLAHLLCEFGKRMDAQGLSGGDGYELPMTQEQLGDALGLTSVHVNRTLRALEAEGVIRRQGRRIAFSDWERVRQIADFSALYLHLGDLEFIGA